MNSPSLGLYYQCHLVDKTGQVTTTTKKLSRVRKVSTMFQRSMVPVVMKPCAQTKRTNKEKPFMPNLGSLGDQMKLTSC